MTSLRPQIVQRIIDADLGFSTVRGTSNLQAILRSSWSAPACFVWRNRALAAPESMHMGHAMQQVRTHYAVVIALKTEKDDGTVEDLAENLSDGVMSALLGWQPALDGNEFLYAGGDGLTDLERNLLLWRDMYVINEYTCEA